ncbi:MAG TPA: hypothetical protein VMH04_10365 [Candidatus Solibacter sp.]|nr:hypothetical protein [Candidatus Solibacter sp.]
MTAVVRSGKQRATVHINSKLEKQLLGYAVVAGAAGVGLLAVAQSAEAKIVYTPLANVPIKNLAIDFNGDGVTDVHFKISYTYHGAFSNAYPGTGGGVAFGNNGHTSGALPLPFLSRIGWKLEFKSYRAFITGVAGCHSYCLDFGLWQNQTNKYLGVKFLINGKPHFGWVRMTVGTPLTGTASGYAYEDLPNKPILAGKTTGPDVLVRNVSASAPLKVPGRLLQTLGVLARGSETMAIWRREEELAA